MLKDDAPMAPEMSDEHASTKVGYRSPPVHPRFKKGQSGNPSGRVKGSKNLKTLFHQILNEKVSLREGGEVKKVTKAEAVMRGLVIGALKGDTRSLTTLFRLAEVSGQFDDEHRSSITEVRRIIVSTGVPRAIDDLGGFRDISTDEP